MVVARGLEIVRQRRQGVGLVPRRVARLHQVARGRIDGHRRVEDDARLLLGLQIGVPLRRAGLDLVPDLGRLAEPLLLVVEVVVGRIVLDRPTAQQRLEVAVEVGDGPQARRRQLFGVQLGHARLGDVGDRAHAVLLGLVEGGQNHLGRLVAAQEEFDPVHAVGRAPAHPLARHFGVADAAARPARTQGLIVVDARRDDLAPGRTGLLRHGDVVRRQADAAHRRHPVGQPQLVDILQVRRLLRAAAMGVGVDEARHHVHAARIDLMRRVQRRTTLAFGQAGPAGLDDVGDLVVLDDDVHRPHRRRARAVDQHGAADHHQRIGAEAFVSAPRRRRVQRSPRRSRLSLSLSLSLALGPNRARRSRRQQQRSRTGRAGALEDSLHPNRRPQAAIPPKIGGRRPLPAHGRPFAGL
ncbi:hypothetical protein D3C73_754970 [compost metagenome]